MKRIPGRFALAAALWLTVITASAFARDRWTPEQANAWYAQQPWLVGCNFNPSTAINQLEMWQAESYDPETIDRELGWAEDLGFNTVRVYLHNLLWDQDRDGFLSRLEQFLEIAEGHGIGVVFVPLDGVWDPRPRLGRQRDPKPHVHNSGWVQAPGAEILGDPQRHDELEPYIVGLIGHFRDDPRIHAWDVFNEPDNDNVNAYGSRGAKTELTNKAEMSALLLQKAFRWAREAEPSQPLTAAVWLGPWPDHDQMAPIEKIMLEESDIVSFHNYGGLEHVRPRVEQLRRYNRPIFCTEYMARPQGSRFDPVLGYFKDQKVAAYNWGFVAGKTQTNYPWDSWHKVYTGEPDVWFHEILRQDGAPYEPREVEYIRSLTGAR
ncbi:MAG: endo-1,4-beta-xylanase [Planctomycetaceae bacterium]|nr:endo-1,4-beta-xylanase [Planctomycetaceae bacterium]